MTVGQWSFAQKSAFSRQNPVLDQKNIDLNEIFVSFS